MKKFALLLALIGCSFFAGCENDNDPSTQGLDEKALVVQIKSDDVASKKEGDIYQFQGTDSSGEIWRVVVTKNTKVFVTRESCSGLDETSHLNVKLDYTIVFLFDYSDVIYENTYTVVRPKRIEAYSPACVGLAPTP